MKAWCKMSDGKLEMCEIAEPAVTDLDDVKIRVVYNKVGTEDLGINKEGDFYSREGVVGYEMSGEIIELGEQARREGFLVGDRVSGHPARYCGTCTFCKKKKTSFCIARQFSGGSMCEYIVWKSSQIVKLNDTVSYKVGCLLGAVAEGLEAIERARLGFGDSVLIWGGGGMGVILIQLARLSGASEITVVDPLKHRRTLALAVGASHVEDPTDPDFQLRLLENTDYICFDRVFETTGDSPALDMAMEYIARGGTLIMMTNYEINKKLPVNAVNMYTNNLTITSVYLSNAKLEIAADVMSSLSLEEIVSRELPFTDAHQAFSLQELNKYHKIAVRIADYE